MKRILLLAALILSGFVHAQISIVPYPFNINKGKGVFVADNNVEIIATSNATHKIAVFLKNKINEQYGLNWQINRSRKGIKKVLLTEELLSKPESYSLEINGSSIKLSGPKEGLFYGIQTLLQLFPALPGNAKKYQIPQLTIKDQPRFSYRGMHLDVARHFFNVEEVKRYIDYLAMHKFNNFHWHLTDDQGWRIQIKKYPLLTEKSSCRDQTLIGRFGSDVYDNNKYCGFYTQEEIKEVIKYAGERYINVIPEIDMPGHIVSALAAYPYLGCTKGPYKVMETWGVNEDILCAGNDSTYKFIEGMLDEVIALFPSRYIHIGGDEAPKVRWNSCPVCQEKIKALHLEEGAGLQSYFIKRIEKYINSKGKKIIGWDEILEGGLAPNATVMSWRGTRGGINAARENHNVIMTPETPLYLNHQQSRNEDSVTQGGYNSLEMVYNYEPVPSELSPIEVKYILGAQGNVWTEYISNMRKLEYTIFPRMSALSEVLWTGRENKSWERFQNDLPALFEKYKAMGSNYSTAYYDLQTSVVSAENNTLAWKVESRNKTGHIIYVKGREMNATFIYNGPIPINTSGTLGAALTGTDHTFLSNWIFEDLKINKASGKNITLSNAPNAAYAGSGAKTLVDGIQNVKGMLRSAQFLGFLGKDLEAIIDLDSLQDIHEIILHAFAQTPSWIYPPSSVSFLSSNDGKSFTLIQENIQSSGVKNLVYKETVNLKARYIKIIAKNYGKIPTGFPGAGTNAWLFADEVEIK